MAVLLAAGIAVDGYAIHKNVSAAKETRRQTELAKAEGARLRAEWVRPTAKQMSSGENFAGMLAQFGLSAAEAADATAAAQRAFNLRQVRAGNTVTVGRSVEGSLREIDYKIDAGRVLRIVPQTPGFAAEVREIPIRSEVAIVSGKLEDSLFNAVEEAGESAEVAMRMAQIFGNDLTSTPIRAGATLSASCWRSANTLTAKPRHTAKSSPPNILTMAGSTRRCSFMIPRAAPPTTRRTAKAFRRPSGGPR